MISKIINKDNDSLLIEWEDKELGFGQLSMKWDNKAGVFILDSEHLGVDSIIKIIKSLQEMERHVTRKNIQVKEDSGIPINDYAPPKGVNTKDIDQLIQICLKLDDSYIRAKERSEQLGRMAQLARAGQKDSEEFKKLKFLHEHPTVTDSSNEYAELNRLMKKFRGKRFKTEK